MSVVASNTAEASVAHEAGLQARADAVFCRGLQHLRGHPGRSPGQRLSATSL